MISIFAGAVCQRMYERWRPNHRGLCYIIRPENMRLEKLLATFEKQVRRVSLSSDPRGADPASRI
jgi:hypothetical protein